MTHHADLGRCCVVWLRPHVERLVPVAATDLEFDPNDISPTPLCVDAVEQLLRVFEDIQHASKGVNSDVSSPCPSRTAQQPDSAPAALEAPVNEPATARPKGSDRCRQAVAEPSAKPSTT
jgi:hypothetical protein